MMYKLAHRKTFLMSMDRFFRRTRQQILGILFAAFLFTFIHSAIHNKFDHHHDQSCAVYVLEQFYFGVDITDIVPLSFLFLPFVFVTFIKDFDHFKEKNYFSIRAPRTSLS